MCFASLNTSHFVLSAVQTPTELVTTNISSESKSIPTLKIHPKSAIVQIKFKGYFPNTYWLKTLFQYCQHIWLLTSLLQNPQHCLTSWHTESHLVFSIIHLFSEKTTKTWFYTLTQSKKLWRISYLYSQTKLILLYYYQLTLSHEKDMRVVYPFWVPKIPFSASRLFWSYEETSHWDSSFLMEREERGWIRICLEDSLV